MDMSNRSYRFYTGTPLFPFGYGLSYTNFSLEWSGPASSHEGDIIFTGLASHHQYSVNVTNTGERAGDEVVQAYFKPQRETLLASLGVGTPVPLKQLFGFERVSLA